MVSFSTSASNTSQAPGRSVSGLVLVDKPTGWTSHDVVAKLRKLAGTRKVGHAGTLDPMATGLLVVGFNKATRLLTHITGTNKTYAATIRLGVNTTTDDADGEVIHRRYANAVTRDRLEVAIAELTGEIDQIPSAVSAIKVGGKRAYQRVRDGEKIELPARRVTVSRFKVTGVHRLDKGKILDIEVAIDCSSGTYIRALARDLGESLNTGGHLIALRRTRVGPFTIDKAHTIEQLGSRFDYCELSQACSELFPVREVCDHEAEALSFGRLVSPNDDDRCYAARHGGDTVIALIENARTKTGYGAKPQVVFVTDYRIHTEGEA